MKGCELVLEVLVNLVRGFLESGFSNLMLVLLFVDGEL